MLKNTFRILVIVITLLSSLSLLKIDKEEEINTIHINKVFKENIIVEKPIGKIVIEKIALNKDLYSIESNKNNIEENITILKESTDPKEENSIIFIAAHSGTSNVSFFNRLDELELKDEVIITYQNNDYKYVINKIEEQPKTGYISGVKENKRQLVLTTCCPKKDNCQLLINAIEKES